MTKGRRQTTVPATGTDNVAPNEDTPTADRKAKTSKGRSKSSGEAQRRYQRECLLSRAFLRDHMPMVFKRIAKQVGRRRPTFKMMAKKKKKGVKDERTE